MTHAQQAAVTWRVCEMRLSSRLLGACGAALLFGTIVLWMGSYATGNTGRIDLRSPYADALAYAIAFPGMTILSVWLLARPAIASFWAVAACVPFLVACLLVYSCTEMVFTLGWVPSSIVKVFESLHGSGALGRAVLRGLVSAPVIFLFCIILLALAQHKLKPEPSQRPDTPK